MANPRVFVLSAKNLLNNYGLAKCNLAIFGYREYSVFPKSYINPTFRKDEQETLLQSEEAKIVSHSLIRPALTTDTSSEFYDPIVLKFINVLMKKGNKVLAKFLVTKAFENVKRIQIQHYHKAMDEEKKKIELDPFSIFHHALTNCTPVLHLESYKKGGIKYQGGAVRRKLELHRKCHENRAYAHFRWM
ncbi:PREDICTED: 28S ribosomal protein S7, mitochondrial isoform X2 [Dinoponera quadriceps]|uniref:28S ribosomal protein S7, mitochondrial isoform X2 n=1 Tax=Dinoponera quadriceps TaxID=609295 RepID=A0A6P3X145_DINQU|nr:PREDICTED: 28S ribosomal protein S7, mitochondrial isoform X2 [Dinoponera quadriceps]